MKHPLKSETHALKGTSRFFKCTCFSESFKNSKSYKSTKNLKMEIWHNQESQNDEPVMVPNDPQIIESKKRLKNGIPVSSEIHKLLTE